MDQYSQVLDDDAVRFEKAKATAGFYLLRGIPKLRQLLEVVLVLGLISWSTPRVPSAIKTASGHAVRFSAHLLNHHVVFLIGNSIVALLFALFRRTNDGQGHDSEPVPPPPPGKSVEEEKQIVVLAAEETTVVECDEVAAAIEKAARQIKRFQRTQSERLRKEIGARPHGELRRSESEKWRRTGEEAADMERLSSDEFQRTVDAFISKHWSKK